MNCRYFTDKKIISEINYVKAPWFMICQCHVVRISRVGNPHAMLLYMLVAERLVDRFPRSSGSTINKGLLRPIPHRPATRVGLNRTGGRYHVKRSFKFWDIFILQEGWTTGGWHWLFRFLFSFKKVGLTTSGTLSHDANQICNDWQYIWVFWLLYDWVVPLDEMTIESRWLRCNCMWTVCRITCGVYTVCRSNIYLDI